MKQSRSTIAFFAVLCALLLVPGLAAAQTAPSTSPDELFGAEPSAVLSAASAAEASFSQTDVQAAGVVFLYDIDNYKFDANGALCHRSRSAYKIITRQGAENWAEVSAWYEPWHEDRPIIKARVISADGTVSVPPESTFSDEGAASSGSSIYSDSKRYAVPLPNLNPGSVVEYELTTVEREPNLARTASFRCWFESEAPVAVRRVVVEYPGTLQLRYAPRGSVPNPLKEGGAVSRLTFAAANIAGSRDFERNTAHDAVPLAYIEFGTGESWNAVARAYAAAVEPLLASDNISAWASEAISGLPAGTDKKSDAAIAAVLLRVRREIRYTGVNFGENTIIPHKPSDTISRGYGDCKDQASLLAAALRSLGVDAKLALLNAGGHLDPRPETPGIGLFDHCIVYLPGRKLWLDPTATYFPGFSLPDGDEDRLALVITPETRDLQPTKSADSTDAGFVESIEYRFPLKGAASVTEVTTASGQIEAEYKNNFAGADAKKVREQLERYVKNAYSAKKLDDCKISGADSHTDPFSLTVSGSESGLATTEYSYARAVLKTGGLLEYLPDELTAAKDSKAAKARSNDLFISLPYHSEFRFHLVPPSGYEASSLPVGKERQLGVTRLTSSFTLEKDGSVTAVYHFDSGKRRLSPAETAATREALRTYLDSDADVLVFNNRGEALLEKGDYLGAIHEFEAQAAANPQDSVQRVHISRALLQAGFASESLAAAKKAVELDSSSADAHQNLAYTYLFDSYGRIFKPGCDIAAAKAEYAKAIELDPENVTNRFNLAILYEYGTDLTRYGRGAQLDEAVKLYRAMQADPKIDKNDSKTNNLSIDLFRLGRYDEALADIGDSPSDDGARSLRAACLAVKSGSDAAIADAGRIEPRVDSRRRILNQAGLSLIQIRRYSEASALLNAAALSAGTKDQASSVAFASMIGRVVKNDAAPDLATAKGYVESYIRALMDSSVSIRSLLDFLPDEQKTRVADAARFPDFEEALTGERNSFLAVGLNPDIFLDFFLSLGDYIEKTEGPITVVSWSIPSDESMPSLICFLEKTDKGYRILDPQNDLSNFGRYAISRFNEGKIEDARSMLLLLKKLDGSDSRLPDFSESHYFDGIDPASAGAADLSRAACLMLCSSDDSADCALASAVVYPFWKASNDEDFKKNNARILTLGLLRAKKNTEAAEVAEYLYHKDEKDVANAGLYALALEASGRASDGDAVAQAGIDKGGSQTGEWKRLLAERLAGRGQYDEAMTIMKSLFPSGQAQRGDYNTIAWYSLYTKEGLPSDFIDRYAIVKRLSGGGDAEIHTLICLLAAQGRISEAHELFESYLNIPAKHDAIVCERLAYAFLAEAFGLKDCAATYYKGAIKYDEFYPGLSVGALADMRLKNLK